MLSVLLVWLLHYLYYAIQILLPFDVVTSLKPIVLYIKSEVLIPMWVTLHLLTLNFVDHFVTQQFVS